MCKEKSFYNLPVFLLITIALLIVVSIYCYLINIKQNKSTYYYFASQITIKRSFVLIMIYCKNGK